MNSKVIDISKKTFISVVIILFLLMTLTAILTYVIPKGEFAKAPDGTVLYDEFTVTDDAGGISILKAVFSPVLLLFADGGIALIMLSLFLVIVSGTFQVMNDVGGMRSIVARIITAFGSKEKLLVSLICLIFMIFGSFFGLFEETLTLLPLIVFLALSLGYDSFTGFVMCIVATGMGFASAITNPFTIIYASSLVNISPMSGVWIRILVFLCMYALLLLFVFRHIASIKKDPASSPTYEHDRLKANDLASDGLTETPDMKRTRVTYTVFLLSVLVLTVVSTSLPALRDYTVVVLTAVFLIGGIVAGLISKRDAKYVFKHFLSGVVNALPAIVLVLMASSIKYILTEGKILDTLVNGIKNAVAGKSSISIAYILFGIILVLEFMISSSTAKAMFIMGILGGVSLGISKELLVLIYMFGDGYTNILFPTSPVLLIGLSMCGMSYFGWLKKAKFLFPAIFILVLLAIAFCVAIGF